jgi:hypothetical protein
MAAGLGFKTFNTGDVLSAADVNGYLMQGILVFADATARDAAITSPEEGQFAFLKDTNVTTYYTGSAWANVDTTGMTNPMTTTGDVIYSSSGSTPDRLGIGTAGQVLQVNSGATAPEWATPASGKVVQIKQAILTGNVSTSSGVVADSGLTVSITPTSASNKIIAIVSLPGWKTTGTVGSTAMYGRWNLYRGAELSQNLVGIYAQAAMDSGAIIWQNPSITYVDSPATTSAITYKVQYSHSNGTATFINTSVATATIVVMEVVI